MTTAALVVVHSDGSTQTTVLPARSAIGWADHLATDERTAAVSVVFNDLTVSVFK